MSENVRQGVARLGQALAPLQDTFVSDLVERSLREIDAYHGILDLQLSRLLRASIEENVIAIVHMLEHDIDPNTLDAPLSATAYTRRLAQLDVPLAALLRNYRIGQADFLELAISHVLATEREAAGPIMKSLVQLVSAYIDAVSEQVTHAYEEERDRWVHRHGAILSQRVLEVLRSTTNDPPPNPIPGYELDHTHLGVIAWLDPSETGRGSFLQPDEILPLVASAVGSTQSGLVIPRDDKELWLWLRPGHNNNGRIDGALRVADLPTGVRLAAGSPHPGFAGFRRTHRQAQQVKAAAQLATNAPQSVATFAELGPIAMMSHDMPTLRSWVGEVLGPLAADDTRSERLRESLRVFLEHNKSYVASAAQLHVHRNSMLYRIRRAQEQLGKDRNIADLNIQLALTTVRWLGSAALPTE